MIAVIEDEALAFCKMNEIREADTSLRFPGRIKFDPPVSGITFGKRPNVLEKSARFNYYAYDTILSVVNRSMDFDDFEVSEPIPPANAKTQESVVSLQKWEGKVLEVLANSFTARLTDLTKSGSKEDAEFSFNELADDDRSLLKSGASFYWTIGRLFDVTNRARTISEIRFRRLPKWTEEEIRLATTEATELAQQFGID